MPQPTDDAGPVTLESSVPVANRRLPTRVSNACRRCRRNKSRCDSYRPCSLCSRANVECEPAPIEEAPRSRVRCHNQRRVQNLRRNLESTDSNGDVPPAPASSFPQGRHVDESVGEEPASTKVPEPTDRRGSWVPVDYGESESAMGIARKRAVQDSGEEWHMWSDDFLKIVESRLVQIMDQHSIAAVQTLILLGSHHVYHGRPNLAFALLGATIKLSHAMGLHRNLTRGAAGDIEERKRVWWTIYTWDRYERVIPIPGYVLTDTRFASISYGRPLSINDEDCNLKMPTEFTESPYFIQESIEKGLPGVIYSAYQTELSKLYLIASPVLKTIFGSLAARSAKQDFEFKYASLVNDVTQKLNAWRRQLPRFLSLDLNQDYHPGTTGWSIRAHLLQSLSLQLTFDNLLIVLHRPFLARQVEHLSSKASAPYANVSDTASPLDRTQSPSMASHNAASPSGEPTVSSEHWWNAAVRTVRVTELPQLAQLATDSHLVAFMAMNLFHAAIVLILVALSDPLSDPAQGVKRTITRVFRLQELLGQRSALSSQSSFVLKNLICLLLRREGEAMLGPVTSNQMVVDPQQQQSTRAPDSGPMSVQDTLRLPLEAAHSTSHQGTERQVWPSLSMTQRFNESLASVQRILPPFPDETLQPDVMTNFGAEGANHAGLSPGPEQQMWQGSFGQPSDYQESQQPVQNHDGAMGFGANDLFWLWDPSWSGGSAQ
ncbi:hypothetical protein G7Z17_g1695 [Cylindrodendrum hubeiense]|uniref:Zn(2)-C6 fungal-type domain-containing protein n=1 Tax=Cylindrodendrum hubeiense TaxID=595255 RepID=A0A9P5HFJ2_9HYPO|nr:hypothetical protein G7Z17_g1695 [Cylindrodendrum hubeiense]